MFFHKDVGSSFNAFFCILSSNSKRETLQGSELQRYINTKKFSHAIKAFRSSCEDAIFKDVELCIH